MRLARFRAGYASILLFLLVLVPFARADFPIEVIELNYRPLGEVSVRGLREPLEIFALDVPGSS